MPNPTPEALVAKWREAAPTREDQFNDRTNTATADTLHRCADELESALASREPAAQPEAAPAGGEAVDLIPWLYVIRSEFLPDDASLGRESDRKMREALDWATNAMRDRAALSQQPGVPDLAMAMHWIDRYAAGIDGECQLDRVCDALGVQYAAAPQPGKEG